MFYEAWNFNVQMTSTIPGNFFWVSFKERSLVFDGLGAYSLGTDDKEENRICD